MDWRTISAKKRQANFDKIPSEWRISDDIRARFAANDRGGVLEVPKSCGILTSEELNLTENYDASQIAGLIRSGAASSV